MSGEIIFAKMYIVREMYPKYIGIPLCFIGKTRFGRKSAGISEMWHFFGKSAKKYGICKRNEKSAGSADFTPLGAQVDF